MTDGHCITGCMGHLAESDFLHVLDTGCPQIDDRY